MRIDRLQAEHFRNLDTLEISPCPGVNIIYGDNAQGKTNLLEGLWLFCGARSFRGAHDREMVQFGQEYAHLALDFFGQDRPQSAKLVLGQRRGVTLNGVSQESASKLAGTLCMVVFSPDHLSLVKDGPAQRRRLMDVAIRQLLPKYDRILSDYNRILQQRNALLKDLFYHEELRDTLEIWDQYLAQMGAVIVQARLRYVQRLQEQLGAIFQGLSAGREQLDLAYTGAVPFPEGISRGELQQLLLTELRRALPQDLRGQSTSVGPHRDDLELSINGKSVRKYGSQGQQRSSVLALKLAECAILKQVYGEEPVVLLDDVMSELDSSRRDYLLNHMQGRQVFLTCCDPGYFRTIRQGRSFHLQNGAILQVQDFGPV